MDTDTLTFHLISTGKYKYYLSILTKYLLGKPISYGLNLGGKMRGCVTISVEVPNREEKDERFIENEIAKKIAYISWIGYNKKCSISEDFPSGVGTRHMVKTAMSIVCSKFNWIENFFLTDSSKVTCKEGLIVNLANLSLITNGKTYYEKYLSAILDDANLREFYENRKKQLESENKYDLQYFIDQFRVPTEQHNIFIKYYPSAKSLLDFFNKLKAYCNENHIHFCEFVDPWIEAFVKKLLVNPNKIWMATWVIHKKDIKLLKVPEWSDVLDIGPIQDAQNILQQEEWRAQSGGHISSFLGSGDADV